MVAIPHYFLPVPHSARTLAADLCIYGGSSGGAAAAIEASRRGLEVVIVEPGHHLGGLTAGGLGMTDIGNKHAVGGVAREFHRRLGRHYGTDEEWRFEPHVAERVFDEWLEEAGVTVFRGQFLDRVQMDDRRITALSTISGLTVRARMFIDATYEGDLMARAGVSYCVGRESNSVYGETCNGAQVRELHQFDKPVCPYVVEGVPASGVLPGIAATAVYRQGEGDSCVQAYNFRMCLTRRGDIRIPFPKPAAYNPDTHILLKRYLATGWNEAFENFNVVRNGKTDTNNHGAVSTDFIGLNHAYPEADYLTREKIFQDHVTYQQGQMWCLANDPDIPSAIREPMSEWGLAGDEFVDSGHWAHALYVRESRRMISDYVMTEHNTLRTIEAPDSVGMASYGIDSHNCQRIILNGRLVNEGDVQIRIKRPYPVSYRSIVPRASECRNLFVTFCVSSSHVSFGSIRMEPVFMVLSQSAAVAASLALEGGCDVQDVAYETLRSELLGAGQVLDTGTEIENTLAHSDPLDVV